MAIPNVKYYLPVVKSHHDTIGLSGVQFKANASDPTDSELEAGRLHYKTSVGLRWYDGSSWHTISTGGGTLNSWDEIYALDKTLTIDSTTLTYALTHATNDGLTLTGSAGSSGSCLQITNAGSGKDINGTSSAWSITKAGLASFATNSVVGGVLKLGSGSADGTLQSNGNYDLILKTGNATTLTFTLTDGANGDADLALNGTGKLHITGTTTHNSALTVGAGDVVVSTGHLSVTDDQNAASFILVNNTANTFAGVADISSTSLTSGSLVRLTLTEGTLSGGYYLDCYDATATASVFLVGEDGITTIAGYAAGTNALTLTVGDLFLSDTDSSVIESEDGTGTLLTVDNKLGIIASDSAVLLVDAGGAVASGGNALRVIFSGTADAGAILAEFLPDAGSLGIKVDAGGKDTNVGLYVDADPTTVSVAYLHSDAVMANNKAILEIDHATGASASGSNLVRIYEAATPNAGAIAFEMDVQKDMMAVYIDSDAATNDAFTLTGQGNIATSKSMLRVSNTGTPAAADSYLAVFDYSSATHTNNPVAVRIASGSTTAQALEVVSTGAGANNKGVLSVTTSGATAAGGSVLRATATGTPASATSYLLDLDYSGATMTNNPVSVFLNAGASTGDALQITGSGAGNSFSLYNTNTGTTGVQIFTEHTSTGSAAANDIVFQLTMAGLDDADATNNYGRIICQANAVAAGSEDGRIELWASVGGTLTELFAVESTSAGAKNCDIKTATCTLDGSAAGTTAFTITNGDLSLSAGGFDATTTADQYGLDIVVNKATATQGAARIQNSSATSGKSVLELVQSDLDKPYMKFSGSTAISSATAGSSGDVPAQVQGYLKVDIDGTERLIPYYNV